VLTGTHGGYLCPADDAEVSVPATVQAAIEARIDRLTGSAKRALNAASVIGARFAADVLTALGIDPVVDELLGVELVDQVRSTPSAEYAFRHPMIRAVAYESQLKSDRAQWHRRLAAAIEERAPGALEENAALIAEHLEAADELRAAYGWHMRAAAWLTNRDVGAARISWERARRIADTLPDDDPDQLSMRIAPRTMLCATDNHAWTVRERRGRFAELRKLCSAAGDKVSLAVGMAGPATELLFTGRPREASRLLSEQMTLLESIGDPTLTMGLAFTPLATRFDIGEFDEVLRLSQIIIDLAAGDPVKGAGFGIGSPLAIALAFRGIAGWWLGFPRWRQDLHDAAAMARSSDPTTFALTLVWAYGAAIRYGVLRADDSVVRAIEEAVQTAERTSNDYAVGLAEYALGGALLNRDDAADRRRGLEIMMRAREELPARNPALVPITDLVAAPERARRGERDAAIEVMRFAVDELRQAGRLGYVVYGTRVLVETLLERGAETDLAEAEEAIDRLANLSADESSAMLEITLLQLRALLARACGEDVTYRDLVGRYRAMAESLGFEGHLDWAETMTDCH
jgi:hypothetical protein